MSKQWRCGDGHHLNTGASHLTRGAEEREGEGKSGGAVGEETRNGGRSTSWLLLVELAGAAMHLAGAVPLDWGKREEETMQASRLAGQPRVWACGRVWML